MKVGAVGVHVLDTHVIGIESIPEASEGQLVETIRMSPAGSYTLATVQAFEQSAATR
jgi:hypothetical protein